VEYRVPFSVQMIGYVFGPVLGLLGAFLFVGGAIMLADPASVGSTESAGLAVRSLIGFCGGAGIVLLGLRITRTVLLERLKVTGDGLISQVAGWGLSTRSKTIPWSSVTSFAPKPSGRLYSVYAVLASGEQVDLAATARERRAAETIAEELTRLLRMHQDDSRSSA
jgi:hypothetical protein